jgi:hypothetical protein
MSWLTQFAKRTRWTIIENTYLNHSTRSISNVQSSGNETVSIPMGERLPPHNLDAERFVLAVCLVEPEKDRTAEVAKSLKPADFFRADHQRFFAACLACRERGLTLCGPDIHDELVTTHSLTDDAANVLINEVIAAYVSSANLAQNIERVFRDARYRDSIDAGKSIIDAAYARDLAGVASAAHEIKTSGDFRNGHAPHFDREPRSIVADLLPVAIFDSAKLLPASLHAWISDIANRASLPIEFPAVAALVSLASVIGRQVGIRPKAHDDWTVIPNLWGGVVGPPGVLKTTALNEGQKPIDRLAAAETDAYAEKKTAFKRAKHIAMAKAEAATAALKKRVKNDEASQEELDALADAIVTAEDNAASEPVMRRYSCNDSTVEKLADLLAVNPNGLLVVRDEFPGFIRSLDKQGHENDKAFYLEAWQGDGKYITDRIGRGTVIVKGLCLSLLGGIQPGPLARLLRDSASGDQCDGFVQRMQLLVYPDTPDKFVNVDKWPETEAKNRAYALFTRLADIDTSQGSFQREIDKEGVPYGVPFLRFTPDAQESFNSWRTDLETRLRSNADHEMMTTHLAKYRSLMPSLALVLHLANQDHDSRVGPVDLIAAQTAIAWCVLADKLAKSVTDPANRASLANPFTPTQVVAKNWSGLSRPDDVEVALATLEDRGWIKVLEKNHSAKGGRPSKLAWINPAIVSMVATTQAITHSTSTLNVAL